MQWQSENQLFYVSASKIYECITLHGKGHFANLSNLKFLRVCVSLLLIIWYPQILQKKLTRKNKQAENWKHSEGEAGSQQLLTLKREGVWSQGSRYNLRTLGTIRGICPCVPNHCSVVLPLYSKLPKLSEHKSLLFKAVRFLLTYY